jgi:hypothetical protein
MYLDEAGRLQAAWKTKHGDKPCHHARVIDSLFEQDGQSTGNVGCQECGAIFSDPRQYPQK